MGLRPSRHRRPVVAERTAGAGRFYARPAPHRLFTLEQANHSLVFLRPVVADLCDAFAGACRCHERMRRGAVLRDQERWVSEQDQAIARFDRALDEIESVGAELLCCQTGDIAFPALIDSHPARFIWSPRRDSWTQVCLWPRLQPVPAAAAAQ